MRLREIPQIIEDFRSNTDALAALAAYEADPANLRDE